VIGVVVLDTSSIAPLRSHLFSLLLFRPKTDGSTTEAHVFGKGILDLIDDVFWHLPFSSKNQAKLVRQDNNITEDMWNARRKTIRAEHRNPNARDELARLWKERIRERIASGAAAAAGAGAVIDDEAIPMEEED
jgi:hypothetical protein